MQEIRVKSRAFGMDDMVPRRYTGEGRDASPPISWEGVPENTKELALICDDPDAPTPAPWVHWVLYRIPAEMQGLPENLPKSKRPMNQILQGENSWGHHFYNGPLPPQGHGTHHYHLKVYALDKPLDLEPGESKEQLLEAMQGHVIGEGELVGKYKR